MSRRFWTREEARDARAVVEASLGPQVKRWPWSPRLSAWIDALLVIEEDAG